MITCTFENNGKALLRHVVTHAIVEKDGCLLLEKRTGPILESGKWALPGGFLDRDETVEECVIREVLEETGWQTEVVSLFRVNSSPSRPKDNGRQNVAFEFILQPIQQTQKFDTKESSKVEWIPFNKLRAFEDFAFDHGETIRLYLEYRKKQFNLPIIV